MAYGYSSNAPSYGYQKAGGSPLVSPYYKAAQMRKNAAGLFGNGLIHGESKADTPFTSLASSGGTKVAPKKTTPTYTQDQVAASLAANPHAAGANGSNFTGDFSDDPSMNAQAPASLYDYRTDPILQEINALSTQTRQGAETGALALKKQLAIKYGDKQLGTQIGDPLTAQAAEQNPNSVFAQLKQMYDTGARNADEQYNKDNLFYGGHRILGQQDLANQYQSNLAGVTANEQDALGQIDQNRLAAILGANQSDINAHRDAGQRAIDRALAEGWSFGGWDSNGDPILTPPKGKDSGGGDGTTPPTGGDTPAPGGDTTPTPPGGDPNVGDKGQLPVGSTNNALIYALLGRKMDPRYQQ